MIYSEHLKIFQALGIGHLVGNLKEEYCPSTKEHINRYLIRMNRIATELIGEEIRVAQETYKIPLTRPLNLVRNTSFTYYIYCELFT